MSPPHELLAWLSVTDIDLIDEEDLRALLEGILESTPEAEVAPWEALLDELMDQLDSEQLDHETIKNWPHRFAELAPELAEADDLVTDLIRFAQELKADKYSGTRLQIFLSCLLTVDEPEDSQAAQMSAKNLGVLEADLFEGWNQYAGTLLTDYSPRSLATHRVLTEAYESWEKAIGLAREGDGDLALQEAMTGSRLFAALEAWGEVTLKS